MPSTPCFFPLVKASKLRGNRKISSSGASSERIFGKKHNVISPRAQYSPPYDRLPLGYPSTLPGYPSTLSTHHSKISRVHGCYACYRDRRGQEHKQFTGDRQSARCVLEPHLLLESPVESSTPAAVHGWRPGLDDDPMATALNEH
jgi:hypothetical protein